MGRAGKDSHETCPVCGPRRAGGAELYEIREGADLYLFSVDRAKGIVTDGRPSISLPAQTLEKLVAVNHYDPLHLPHVEPDRPGIALMLQGGLVLLDGAHRAARCLRESRVFGVQVLNQRESQECLVPEEAAPEDAAALVRRLREIMTQSPGSGLIEADLPCGPRMLNEVRALLTPTEKRRLRLRARAGRGGPSDP